MKNLYNFEIKEVKQNYFVLIPEDEITNEQLKKEKSKQITMTKSKNRILSHHRKFFAIMNKFLENIDEQMSIDELLIVLKLKTKKHLKDHYIRERMPVALSNISDVWSLKECDFKKTIEIIEVLKSYNFPIFWETKGCKTDEDLKYLKDIY